MRAGLLAWRSTGLRWAAQATWVACALCAAWPARAPATHAPDATHATPAEAATQTAWVSWVMDGDTVLLLPEGAHEALRVRLVGIDAPEHCQPGGEAARDALIALVLRRSVRLQVLGQDSYGRQLGRLWRGEQDVAAEMVRSGWAWAYQHRTGRGPYAALQRQAERERVGVFGAPETAMSPAVFRQFHGSCHVAPEAQAPTVVAPIIQAPSTQAPGPRVPQTGQPGSR